MPTIRTQLELIDNMSNRFARIEAAARQSAAAGEQLQAAYSSSSGAQQLDYMESKLSLQERALEQQGARVEMLKAKYESLSLTHGKDSERVQEISTNLLAAEMAELRLQQSANATADAIDKQQLAALAVTQALERTKMEQEATWAKAEIMSSEFSSVVTEISSKLASMSGYAQGMDLEIFKPSEIEKYSSQLDKVQLDLYKVRNAETALNSAINSNDISQVNQAMKNYDTNLMKLVSSNHGAVNATERLKSAEWQRIEVLEQTKRATDEAYATNAYEKTKQQIIQMQVKQRNVTSEIEASSAAQNQFTNAVNGSASAASGLLGRLKQIVSIYAIVQGVKKLFNATAGSAIDVQKQVSMMSAQFGNADVGEAYFKKLQKRAVDAGMDINDLTGTMRNFMSYTKNTDKLDKFLDISERLAMKNPEQGVSGAAYAIQEAMSGQFTSLRNRFNLSNSQLAPLKEAVKTGNIEGIQEALVKVMNNAGITDEVVEAYRNSAANQINSIKTLLAQGFAGAGEKALESLQPVFEQIKSWLQSEDAIQFFSNISVGIGLITSALVWAGQMGIQAAGWIKDNWGAISPILYGIIGALALYKMYMLIAGSAGIIAATQTAIAWAVANWPILLIISILAIAITVLRRWGITWEQICGFVGGLIGTLYANIYNNIAFIWNILVSFAEFFTNFFIDPAYAFEKLFYDVTITVLGFFNSMFTGIIKGLNWVIDKINGVLDTNIGHVQVDFVDNMIDNIKAHPPTTNKNVVDLPRMDYKDVVESGLKGKQFGEQLPGKIKDTIESFKIEPPKKGSNDSILDDYNKNAIDSLGSLDGIKKDTGKIKENTEKVEDDLKWLKDIAEREQINRFTTANLAPQLKIEIANVNQNADIDGITDQFTREFREMVAIAAEGV